jgi:hypothetical protein
VQSGGTWNVTPAGLSGGTRTITASVTDPAGNNATSSTTVTVSTVRQPITTLVQANGTWNATATSVPEGTSQVVAAAPDSAGNVGNARQTFTVDTDAPSGSGGTGATGGPRLTVSLPASGVTTPRGNAVQVPFVLGGPGKVAMTVLRGHKVLVKLSVALRKAGHGRLTWNGRIKGKLAPSGTYKVIVQAVSPTGASIRGSRHGPEMHVSNEQLPSLRGFLLRAVAFVRTPTHRPSQGVRWNQGAAMECAGLATLDS